MKRDRLMMFGAITALTLSLFWAIRFIPAGVPGAPSLLSIGSLVHAPPAPVSFEAAPRKRCGFTAQAVILREKVEQIRHQARNIRIEVLRGNRHKHKHKHLYNYEQVHKHQHVQRPERERCRGRMSPAQPTMPIPPIPPVPPLAPMAPIPPLPAPGS